MSKTTNTPKENATSGTATGATDNGAGYQGMTIEELVKAPMVYRDGLFDGQPVVISGGGSGMGRAMAVLFARLGAQVIICGRREEKLAEVRHSVKQHIGRDIETKSLNIRDAESVETFMAGLFQKYGTIHTLINSAGGQFSQAAIDFSRKGWLAVIDTNLNGTWWMMQEAAKGWRKAGKASKGESKGGNIINIAAYVERGMPQSAHSCAARAGVIYLSKTLATEWAEHHIRVNCIAPGAIKTEGVAQYPEEALKAFHHANPMKHFGDVWDIAQTAAYLAAPSAKFVTGEVLVVDGGMAQYGWVWPLGKPDYFKS